MKGWQCWELQSWVDRKGSTMWSIRCPGKANSCCLHLIFTLLGRCNRRAYEMILGHEAIGEIMEVGALVKDFKKGDKVLVPAITPDWGSINSQRGFPMHSGEALGGWKFSNFKDGCFAELFHVNEADANLAHLPEDIDPVAAVMITDMTTTGFHAAELAEVEIGDTVCVIGIGPVGLNAVAGANLMGASYINAVGSRRCVLKSLKSTRQQRLLTTKMVTLWNKYSI